jgi:hypothetical protein
MRTNTFAYLAIFFAFITMDAQDLGTLSTLEGSVEETSGLIYFDGRTITHNDSGGGAILFEVNESTGQVTRQVSIANATNRDWEDIEQDESYIYIGDFGNNNGNRRDLRILKVSKSDYLDGDDTATAEVIEFIYEDQTDFTSSNMNTNYDAEGLIAYEDFLFVFTKNWIDGRTNIYRLSKDPGSQTAVRVDDFNSEGLITGATYNSISDRVILVGYSGISPFLTQLSGFSNGEFSNGSIIRTDLNVPAGISVQIEAIGFENGTRHLLTSESSFLGDAGFMDISLSTLSTENLDALVTLIYPNPAKEKLWISIEPPLKRIEIYDFSGKLVLEKKIDKETVSLDELPRGSYLIRLYNESGVTVKKLIRE